MSSISIWDSFGFRSICLLISYKPCIAQEVVCGPFLIISKTALLTLCQLIPAGSERLPPISTCLRLPKNLFCCKMLICHAIVRIPIPILILPDPLSVKKYKSGNCRRCCKRVVSTNCQINKSERMILHNIVRRAGTQWELIQSLINTENNFCVACTKSTWKAHAHLAWFQLTLSFPWKRKLGI